METNERVIPHVLRLARLLENEAGTEILAEMQKIALISGSTQRSGRVRSQEDALPQDATIGVWKIVDNKDGTSLRRETRDPAELRMWADVAEIPCKGRARRLVLIGESSARGFLLDPTLTPARTLEFHLDQWAGKGEYQCIDLAHTGASIEDVEQLLFRARRLSPDVVVLFAGTNWSVPRYSLGELDALSKVLRSGGYGAMRDAFWPTVVLPRAKLLLARIEELLILGTEVIVIIPEFNLREWCPPPAIDLPVLPSESLITWYQLKDQAEIALQAQLWNAIPPLTRQMRLLDEGCSPVTGYLLGRALEALGDGSGARAAYEESRDSICGLLVSYSPRITRPAQDLLIEFCKEHTLSYVDLRELLAADDLPQTPDPQHFLDYCHLSASGIDLAMSAVAAIIQRSRAVKDGVGYQESTRVRLEISPDDRAASHLMAACYNAYCGQPATVLRRHLRATLALSPNLLRHMAALLDLLEGIGPMWVNSQLYYLIEIAQIRRYLETLIARRAESLGLWVLRSCLAELLPDRIQLVSHDQKCWIELLEVPTGDLGVGHTAPNFTTGRCYIQATSRSSHLYFALNRASSLEIELNYRMMMTAGAGSIASVAVNDIVVGALPFAPQWSLTRLCTGIGVQGVNRLTIQWPIGATDYNAHRNSDAAALSRGDYPYVLPVFGEIYSVCIHLPASSQSAAFLKDLKPESVTASWGTPRIASLEPGDTTPVVLHNFIKGAS